MDLVLLYFEAPMTNNIVFYLFVTIYFTYLDMCAVHLAILDDTEEVVSSDHGRLGTLHKVHQLIRVDRRDLVLQYESIDRVNEGHQDTSQLVSGKVLDGLGVTLCPLRLTQPTKDESGSQELLLLG